jgi:hypothetical protein
MVFPQGKAYDINNEKSRFPELSRGQSHLRQNNGRFGRLNDRIFRYPTNKN